MVEGQAQTEAISNSVSNTLGCNKRGATAHLRNNQSHQEAQREAERNARY